MTRSTDHFDSIPLRNWPDAQGRFGDYGGRFVPETLVAAIEELSEAYAAARSDKSFQSELERLLTTYAGRPTPLYYAKNLTRYAGGAKIYLKREDLLHTGAHKINNAFGQALLALKMGKNRVIAETGAGQHGVATATTCAMLGLECVIYMGSEDITRQALNVYRMEILGATVHPVEAGSKTLKDAINECMRDWVTNVRTTFYLLGSVVGPHPYPMMVRDFQSVIGHEARSQILGAEAALPACVIACVGGGSNAMGAFYAFIDDPSVRLIGVEAGGLGLTTKAHAAPLGDGIPGVLHGSYSYLLQDDAGQVLPTHSISAGLDYPGVGPEHSHLKDTKRAQYLTATDQEALDAFHLLSRLEGIIPALETAHAVARAIDIAKQLDPDQVVLVCISGRGDKDIDTVRSLPFGDQPT